LGDLSSCAFIVPNIKQKLIKIEVLIIFFIILFYKKFFLFTKEKHLRRNIRTGNWQTDEKNLQTFAGGDEKRDSYIIASPEKSLIRVNH
jgi:hypothetical protein